MGTPKRHKTTVERGKKFRRVGGEVKEAIEELAMRGWKAPDIHEALVERFTAGRAPKLRTVQRWVAQKSDPSGAWRFADADAEDAALLLPVLAALISETRGRRKELSNAEAERVAKICGAAPGVDPWYAYVLARLYMLREQANMASPDIDAYLAYAPWRGKQEADAYGQALEEGWVTMVPHMSPGMFRDYEPAYLKREIKS